MSHHCLLLYGFLCACEGLCVQKERWGIILPEKLGSLSTLGGNTELSGWGCILKWPHSISKEIRLLSNTFVCWWTWPLSFFFTNKRLEDEASIHRPRYQCIHSSHSPQMQRSRELGDKLKVYWQQYNILICLTLCSTKVWWFSRVAPSKHYNKSNSHLCSKLANAWNMRANLRQLAYLKHNYSADYDF